MFVSPAIHGSYEFGRIAYHQYVFVKEMLYEVQSLKSNEDMMLARAGQFLRNCLMNLKTCTGRTGRVKPFTGRICSTVSDKDVWRSRRDKVFLH